MSSDDQNSRHSVISYDTGSTQVRTVMLHGVSIVTLLMNGQERLCLAQISNTLLKGYSYNEIHNRRVALGITCIQCTPVQLELLRRAGAMPVSSRRCGMITCREAERLVRSFLDDAAPPKLPDDFVFHVEHSCGWGCRGEFIPSRYNSSRAKCIRCCYCDTFFSPNKFIFHYHRTSDSSSPAVYNHPDAANFNSWRRHLKLVIGNSASLSLDTEAHLHAWEDVKAMFNGGSRRRIHHHHQHHRHQHRGSSSHGSDTTQHQLPATQTAACVGGGSGGQTAKPVSIDEEFRSTDIEDGRHEVAGTSHEHTSSGQRSTSCVQPHVDNDHRLMLQPPPSAFLAPPPYPFHYSSSPYVTSFPPPLYPLRPRPLTPVTHFRATPFDGFQPSVSGSSSDARLVVDACRQRLLGDVSTSSWRSGLVDTHCATSLAADQHQVTVKSPTDCSDKANKDVEEFEMTDNVHECDHIDVDTVDDLTPPSAGSAAEHLNTLSSDSSFSDITKEPGISDTTGDVSETSSATKRKTTEDAQDGDLRAAKSRLETLLQLETRARRTIEENFQRVKEQLSDELSAKERLHDSINRQLRLVKGSLFLELDHERKTRLVLEQQLKDAKQSLQSLTYGLCCTSSSLPVVAWPLSPHQHSLPLVNNHLQLNTPHHPVQGVLHTQPPFAN